MSGLKTAGSLMSTLALATFMKLSCTNKKFFGSDETWDKFSNTPIVMTFGKTSQTFDGNAWKAACQHDSAHMAPMRIVFGGLDDKLTETQQPKFDTIRIDVQDRGNTSMLHVHAFNNNKTTAANLFLEGESGATTMTIAKLASGIYDLEKNSPKAPGVKPQ